MTDKENDYFNDETISLDDTDNLNHRVSNEIHELDRNEIMRDARILELEEQVHKLKEKLQNYEAQEKYLQEGAEKTKQTFEIARHNAEKIVMKAVDFSFFIRKEISVLLKQIEASGNNTAQILTLIDTFINKNAKIFNFSDEELTKVAQLITNQIVKVVAE